MEHVTARSDDRPLPPRSPVATPPPHANWTQVMIALVALIGVNATLAAPPSKTPPRTVPQLNQPPAIPERSVAPRSLAIERVDFIDREIDQARSLALSNVNFIGVETAPPRSLEISNIDFVGTPR